MIPIRYFLFGFLLLVSSFSGFAQDLERPRLGTFQVEKNTIPEMQDIWKSNSFNVIHKALKLPKITPKNYRTPVDMVSVVAGIENSKRAGMYQELIDNIRISHGTYQKESNERAVKFNSEVIPPSAFGTCVHGNTQRYCGICSPRSRYSNFGFGGFHHPPVRSFYYP